MTHTFSFLRILSSIASVFLLTGGAAIAQQPAALNRLPSPSMPFLTFTPDARSAALGDAGVASSADANAIFWNPAKLVYAQKQHGGALSFNPWLRNITDDMYFTNLSLYTKPGKNQAIGLSLLYFDMGTIQFTTPIGTPAGTFPSREYAITASYSRQLFRNFSMGVNLRYANSDLTGGGVSLGNVTIKPASNVMADISAYYESEARDEITGRGIKWAFGGMISNIGGKVNYGTREQYFLPTNLRLGTTMTYYSDKNNKFNFLVDINKLMVPTPPEYQTVNGIPVKDANGNPIILRGRDPKTLTALGGMFGSFADAPDGFGEELREINLSTGVEYWYNDQFAARVGYFHQPRDKGDLKYITTGFGLRLQQKYGLDFAYLLPIRSQSPLAQTFRITLVFGLDKKERIVEEEDEN